MATLLMSVPSRGVSSAWMGTLVACSLVAVGLLEYRRRRSRRRWPHGVEVRPSRVPGGGDGLFATRVFEAGEALGEYYGQVLSLWQAMNLENRDYLMGGFGPNAHVDARDAFAMPGRYVNDAFDASRLNARFDKSKATRSARVVALRDIEEGEEIFASYGRSYWSARYPSKMGCTAPSMSKSLQR